MNIKWRSKHSTLVSMGRGEREGGVKEDGERKGRGREKRRDVGIGKKYKND